MKKMRLILALLITTFAVACGQKADDTFQKPMYFNYGLTTTKVIFPDGSFLDKVPTGITVNWTDILNKPLVFPPSAHGHKWSEITEKPDTIGLQEAISFLPGMVPPKLTTEQINFLTPVEGTEVYNLTTHTKQYFDGTIWKTYITNQ